MQHRTTPSRTTAPRRCAGPRLVLPVVVLAAVFRLAPAAGQRGPSAEPPAGPPLVAAVEPPGLGVGPCEGLDPRALGDALSTRLGRTVQTSGDSPGDFPAGFWVVEFRAPPDGAVLRLRAPGGALWIRPVPLPGDASETDRVRTVALAAEYLLALARAPFVPAGEIPELPPTVRPPAADDREPRPGETGAPSPAAPPAERGGLPAVGPPPPPPAGGSGGGFDVSLLLGGSADLSSVTRGRSGALVSGLRSALEWPGSLWLLIEAEWHYAAADYVEPLALHQFPVRFGVGGNVRAGRAMFRLALEGVFEVWWSTGGTSRFDWRSGGGLLLSGGYRLSSWLAVGADLGVELLPHGVELLYGDTPVFSLGPWRWRALAWVSFGRDLGL